MTTKNLFSRMPKCALTFFIFLLKIDIIKDNISAKGEGDITERAVFKQLSC